MSAETVNVVRLVIPGAPVGKGRPRFDSRNMRTHTDKKTERAEKDVRAVWREAGAPRLPEGPIVAHIKIYTDRPKDHFTSKGALSAAGLRAPFPIRKPDLDNSAKMLLDALNDRAYRDDAQVVELHVRRMWTDEQNPAATVVTLLMKTLPPVVEPMEGADDPDALYASSGEYPELPDLKHRRAA